MDRSEKIKSLFKLAENDQKQSETQLKDELTKPSNPLHVSFNLFKKGTAKDKMESAKELIQANKRASLFIIKELVDSLNEKLDKKAILLIEGIKAIILGPYKEEMAQLKNFKDYLDEDKALLSKAANLDNADKESLAKYYFWSMLKIHVTTFANKLDILVRQTNNIHLKQLIEILLELLHRSADWLIPSITRSLLYDLSASSNQLVNSIEKAVTLVINNRTSVSLQLAKIVYEKLNAPNLSLDLKRNILSILVSVKFESVEDKNVNYFILEVLLNQLSAFLKLFSDKKDAKRTLMAEKKKYVNIKKLKRKRYSLTDLIGEHIALYSKLLSQCIRGLNKILPCIKGRKQLNDFLDSHLILFFNFCRLSSSKVSIQLLIFMFQIVKYDMYSKLAERYANLLYDLINSTDIFESKLSEQVFDLLLNFIKNDYSSDRVLAFVKRLFNTIIHCDSKIVITGLLFFAKLAEHKIILQNLVHNKAQLVMDGNDEENYKDVDESEEEEIRPEQRNITPKISDEHTPKQAPGYSFEKRNPLYANAKDTFLWELVLLKNHYNPIVRKLTNLIINLKFAEIDYKGNPLNDFSYSAIFRRFAVKAVKDKTQNKKLQNERLKINEITYENYKDVLVEDEAALKLYFENKVNQIADTRKNRKKRRDQVDDIEDEDAFADELFEKEMVKMNGGKADEDDDELADADELDEDFEDEEVDDVEDGSDYNEFSDEDDDFADAGEDYKEPLTINKRNKKGLFKGNEANKKVKSN